MTVRESKYLPFSLEKRTPPAFWLAGFVGRPGSPTLNEHPGMEEKVMPTTKQLLKEWRSRLIEFFEPLEELDSDWNYHEVMAMIRDEAWKRANRQRTHKK